MSANSVKLVAANGMVGTGFLETSLTEACAGADIIGCDAGTADLGPYYLGSGELHTSVESIRRDLALMLDAALQFDIPLVIGSCGTAGSDSQVDLFVRLVSELAGERGWHFPLAVIQSELRPADVVKALEEGKVSPLSPVTELSVEQVSSATRVVAVMGVEPIQAALANGAHVVLAGRSSDVSIFAALPMMRGIPAGIAMHAAKVLECGAACVERRAHPDSMAATLDSEGFTIEPPNPLMGCSPQSIAAHTFYETSNPHKFQEPNGTVYTNECVYERHGPRGVRVTGSHFKLADTYTLKLEGTTLAGYRSVVVAGGLRDPVILRQLDSFLSGVAASIKQRVSGSLGLKPTEYSLQCKVYGRDGTLGAHEPTPAVGHEVGLIYDIVASSQYLAKAIGNLVWHTGAHHPVPEFSGTVNHFAMPFSPPVIDAGPVYEFCFNHVIHPADPCQLFRTTTITL